jgi:hypothetical protein
MKYQAVCAVCYTCVIATTTSRRDADCAATSHMNAYGHNVTVLPPKLPKVKK